MSPERRPPANPSTSVTARIPPLPRSDRWKQSEQAARRTNELVFFAHMQIADAADRLLARHKLGRPHHRVLYFACRQPGITVGELMGVLRISNQALARTTNQLVALGLLEQRYSLEDRRVRQNHATDRGLALLNELAGQQLATIRAAHATLTGDQIEGLWSSLAAIARAEDLVWVTAHPVPDASTHSSVDPRHVQRNR